ncbi:MAG: hypothetical protein Q9181_008295, partial [Wetmoreana brouardii]
EEYESSLRAAAQFGQIEAMKKLLKAQKLDLQAAEAHTGLTALHCAAMTDQLDAVKLLLAAGADLCKTDRERRTAIHHSTQNNSLQCLQYFVQEDISTISPDAEGLTPWHWAALFADKQALEILVKHSRPMPRLSDLKARDGRSPLLCAASGGSAENVDVLLHAGCTVTETANDGSTVLHQAARSGSLRTVQLLLDKGSHVRAVTKDGSTVLHYALLEISDGFTAIVDLLVQQGVDPCKTRDDGITPIHMLIRDGAESEHDGERKIALQKLVPLAGNTNYTDSPPFNKICQLQPPRKSQWLETMFEVFLEHSADLGSKDPEDRMALQSLTGVWRQSCSERSKSGTMDHFSVTSTNMMHKAMEKVPLTGPLHDICTSPDLPTTAILIGDEELVYKFLEHSPDVDASPGTSSVIKAACMTGCSDRLLQDLLLRSKIYCDKDQGSGLIWAACEADTTRSFDIVKALLNAGLSPNDNSTLTGESPLMVAARLGNVDIM